MRELSLNILDIVGNSTKAKATIVAITLTENTKEKTLEIVIEDNGHGMDEDMLKSVTDPFTTSRTTRRVGLGIPFFKMAAESTEGEFSINSTLGEGTLVRALFHTDHMDFVPLGDIGATLALLISGSPDTDFVYTYDRDGDIKELSTLSMREELGGIPLDTPEVILWLNEYTKQFNLNYMEE